MNYEKIEIDLESWHKRKEKLEMDNLREKEILIKFEKHFIHISSIFYSESILILSDF